MLLLQVHFVINTRVIIGNRAKSDVPELRVVNILKACNLSFHLKPQICLKEHEEMYL